MALLWLIKTTKNSGAPVNAQPEKCSTEPPAEKDVLQVDHNIPPLVEKQMADNRLKKDLPSGDWYFDFANGEAKELFMSKANFQRQHNGEAVVINPMDFLTVPDNEIQGLLQSGYIKADRLFDYQEQ